ncbi:ADP-ribosylhydrolase ARH3 [Nematostella vectensis]|uniref:ADP-ribosylhydrolase ARH3 n=1 Tax=Nematostella vectensis TaxID=45351 RepID=UPI0020770D01|nr:ADP-ribosylhydrolase ARH3 [Nematostella vectensis]
MLNKFRGSLVGALIGDCLGSFYEAESNVPIPLKKVVEYTSKTIKTEKDGGVKYTDDSAMTRAICLSITESQDFDDRNMAYHFTKEYFCDSNRGYGAGVVTVFNRLRTMKPDADFTLPAREQFNGTGSYGNGAAMRIAPIALYSTDLTMLKEYARRSALITHSHVKGVNGAILQACAVFEALHVNPTTLEKNTFIDNLIKTAVELEESQTDNNSTSTTSVPSNFSYVGKLNEMKQLLSSSKDKITPEKVVEVFGNGIRAEQAVPAAIFSFLFNAESFQDCVNYAISLGGDTDTIASMAGAISGAYFGLEDHIPQLWVKKCEAVDEAVKFADEIYRLRESKVKN